MEYSTNQNTLSVVEGLRLAVKIKSSYVRPKSVQDYKNYVDRFERYAKKEGFASKALSLFSRRDALLYLDHILASRNINAATRNNYMRNFRALFYTLVEREYIKVNPFADIKRIKESRKKRRTFTPQEKLIIAEYLKEYDQEIFLAVCLCYYCALRPVELRRLKVRNIDLQVGMINLDGSQTKNKEVASITIPKLLLPYLRKLNLHRYDGNAFLFGLDGLKTGMNQCGRDRISKRHKRALEQLKAYGFIQDIEGKTFYSWKDTSAKDLINEGLNILDLKQHFRHNDITTTQRYIEMHKGANSKIRDINLKLWKDS